MMKEKYISFSKRSQLTLLMPSFANLSQNTPLQLMASYHKPAGNESYWNLTIFSKNVDKVFISIGKEKFFWKN